MVAFVVSGLIVVAKKLIVPAPAELTSTKPEELDECKIAFAKSTVYPETPLAAPSTPTELFSNHTFAVCAKVLSPDEPT